MIIKDVRGEETISIGQCGSGIGNGVGFFTEDENGNEGPSIFTNNRDDIVKLRDELNEILEDPDAFVDTFARDRGL